jgi:hypothetical protein
MSLLERATANAIALAQDALDKGRLFKQGSHLRDTVEAADNDTLFAIASRVIDKENVSGIKKCEAEIAILDALKEKFPYIPDAPEYLTVSRLELSLPSDDVFDVLELVLANPVLLDNKETRELIYKRSLELASE